MEAAESGPKKPKLGCCINKCLVKDVTALHEQVDLKDLSARALLDIGPRQEHI
jgi:hypothetical protein